MPNELWTAADVIGKKDAEIARLAALVEEMQQELDDNAGQACDLHQRAEKAEALLAAERANTAAAVDKADAWDAISVKNAEIARITAERDRQYDENVHRIAEQAKAEAERDAALAQVADAFEAAGKEAAIRCAACGASNIGSLVREYIKRLTPADAIAARDADRKAAHDAGRVAGLREAADHCWSRRDTLADAEKAAVEVGLTGRDYYGRRLEAELLSRHFLARADAGRGKA